MSKIRRDLSGLPTASPDAVGVAPDPDPWVGRALAQHWLDQNFEAEKAHAVEGTRFRMSMAGMCTRAMAYYVGKVPESNPVTEADAWRMGLGTMVHEALQAVMVKAFPDAEIEVKVHAPDIDGSGHIDIVMTRERDVPSDDDGQAIVPKEWVTSIEVKTIGGFGFKMSATSFKGPPEGPKQAHIAQGALGAKRVDADELIIAYLSMENVSPDLARYSNDPVFGRFTAQWTFTRDEYMAAAAAEEKRIRYVLDKVPLVDDLDEMAQAAAKVPAYVANDDGRQVTIHPVGSGGWIVKGQEGEIVQAGKTWVCGYCRWQDRCKADG